MKLPPKKYLPKTKALLALTISTGILYSLPCTAEDRVKAPRDVVHDISVNRLMTPEYRAYWLLQLADQYLRGEAVDKISSWYQRCTTEDNASSVVLTQGTWSENLVSCAAQSWTKSNLQAKRLSVDLPAENIDCAKAAVAAALNEIDKIDDPLAKLCLSLKASALFERLGEKSDSQRYLTMVKHEIANTESRSTASTESTVASAMALNVLSGKYVEFTLPYEPYRRVGIQRKTTGGVVIRPKIAGAPFSSEEFSKAETLRLRALKLLDRLPAGNHERRLGHRYMVLWYQQTGKPDLADAQKQELFKLVGFEDDSILYPTFQACSIIPIWWQQKTVKGFGACGMG